MKKRIAAVFGGGGVAALIGIGTVTAVFAQTPPATPSQPAPTQPGAPGQPGDNCPFGSGQGASAPSGL